MTSSAIRHDELDPRENPTIRRLLFVADAAAAALAELPAPVRTIIDSAAEVSVVTPTPSPRPAWLADDVDGVRHIADDRLDTIRDRMHSIGRSVTADINRERVLRVIADAVVALRPDHILLALRPDQVNWQERGLVENIASRFHVPVTSHAVNADGRAPGAAEPLLLCYDGSDGAIQAIDRAGALFPGQSVIVLAVWQPTARLGCFDSAYATTSSADHSALGLEAAQHGSHVAGEGVLIANAAGLNAAPLAIEAAGAVWRTILDVAARRDVATIVMGARGLTGLRPRLLGSVSSAVVLHADRPTLIVHLPTPLVETTELSHRTHA